MVGGRVALGSAAAIALLFARSAPAAESSPRAAGVPQEQGCRLVTMRTSDERERKAKEIESLLDTIGALGSTVLFVIEYKKMQPAVRLLTGTVVGSEILKVLLDARSAGGEGAMEICPAKPPVGSSLGTPKLWVVSRPSLAERIAAGAFSRSGSERAPGAQAIWPVPEITRQLKELQRQRSILDEAAVTPRPMTPKPSSGFPQAVPPQPQSHATRLLQESSSPRPQLGSGATVSGVVFDGPSGFRLQGAVVKLVGPAPDTWRAMVTSSDGSYRFDQLPPGTYQLIARKAGYGAASEGLTLAARDEKRDWRLLREAYPCTFTVTNRTAWWIEMTAVEGARRRTQARLAPLASAPVWIGQPGELHAVAFFRDHAPVEWGPTPISCLDSASMSLFPP